ncbi:MAG: AAA family ATPase [Negativicutes bacterium]
MKLLRLTYENFKAQTQNIVLNEADVDIFGANGAGKTTAFDAFTWLLFGKDSKGRELSDDIKERSSMDNGTEHTVEAVIQIDGGAHVKLKRVFHEKWTKKRGSATETFSGHDTDFFVDDVPTKKREYTERINDIMDEAHFKLLTDPLYFKNQLSWQERRKILLEICGDVSDETVIAAKEELSALPEMLGGKSIDDYRKMIQASRAKTNDELKKIPVRIDEVQRGLPDVEGIVEEPLRLEIKDLQKQKESVDRKIAELHTGGATADKKRTIIELEAKQIAVKNRYDQEVNKVALEKQKKRGEVETDIQRAESSVSILKGRMESLQADIEAKGEAIRKTREEWHTENNKTFSAEIADVCPTCGQKIPPEKVEEARRKAQADFNLKKSETLSAITAHGKRLVAKLQAYGDELERLQGSTEAAEEKIRLTKADIAALTSPEDMIADYTQDEEYMEAEREKERLLAEIEQLAKGVESEAHKLETERNAIDIDIVAREEKLAGLQAHRTGLKRIEELQEEQKNLAAAFEEMEHALYLTDLFIKTKVEMLDERINSKFRIAQFRLFETQVNGGVSECCDVLYDGVARMSNSQEIRVGLDIIQTLSEHYGTTTPIFVDNCESVTELPEMDGQIIRLIVSAEDKKLRIERKDKAQKAA